MEIIEEEEMEREAEQETNEQLGCIALNKESGFI